LSNPVNRQTDRQDRQTDTGENVIIFFGDYKLSNHLHHQKTWDCWSCMPVFSDQTTKSD